MLSGIDVSSHNPTIDWATMAKSQQFAVVKATGGNWYKNPLYRQQISEARKAGLVVGHYHFAFEGNQPTQVDAVAEAKFFLENCDVQPGEFVCLDIEDTDVEGNLANWVVAWSTAVSIELKCIPLLYSFPYYMQTRGLLTTKLAHLPLWYAYYREPESPDRWPASPAPWSNITIWQWSGGAVIPGSPHKTDQNVTNLTREQLIALGKPSGENPAPAGPEVRTEGWDWNGQGNVVFHREMVLVLNNHGELYFGEREGNNQKPWVHIGGK